MCPSGALTFGTRDELLDEAWARIKANPDYIQKVYGEKEGGGTRWLYISDVPFKDLGFPEDIPTKSIPATIHDYTKWKPGIFVGAAAVFGALGLYTKRRMKIENEQQQEGGKDNV